ncbi:MAG: SDR family NAD(P)-dependent oxidoreductase [Hyphomicrobiaceae bacterium]
MQDERPAGGTPAIATSGGQRPRTILVTGCSSGIGLASARLLKGRGWRVLATARTAGDLDRLEREGLVALPLELMDGRSVAALAERALEIGEGRLDALFNNAAYGQPGAVEDLTGEVLRAQFEANLFSWHELTRRILPAMRKAGQGRIVQCSSVLGFISPPYRGAYNASKHALEALTEAMRYELSLTAPGIKVSLIEPGPIDTRFLEHAIAAFRSNVPIEGSAHRAEYERRLAAMQAGGKRGFKLPPEAVAAKVVHAVESARPKVRYKVTIPTHMAALGRRFLPQPLYDWMVIRA